MNLFFIDDEKTRRKEEVLIFREEWHTVGKEKKPKKVKTKAVKQNKENKKKEKKVSEKEKQGIIKREVIPLPHDQNHSYSTPAIVGSPSVEYRKEELEKILAELGDGSNYLPPPLIKEKNRIEMLLERVKRKEQQKMNQKEISFPSATTIETHNNTIQQPIKLTPKGNVNVIMFLIIILIIAIVILALYIYSFN
ncbi:hypothetical protein KM1_071640 [Entamoeba histolytica HM-3:IMSS]|uniref:Uncharacterized protein n=1 Tax=Entamoeba histolytica HM-3:IMSS TaxID=885315 RepID=M7W289_ENTHI|nr:hypothetical protein KM1_071640 [Entamoeba histolytica HM-3:IMSS]